MLVKRRAQRKKKLFELFERNAKSLLELENEDLPPARPRMKVRLLICSHRSTGLHAISPSSLRPSMLFLFGEKEEEKK